MCALHAHVDRSDEPVGLMPGEPPDTGTMGKPAWLFIRMRPHWLIFAAALHIEGDLHPDTRPQKPATLARFSIATHQNLARGKRYARHENE